MAKLYFSFEGNSLGEFVINKERTTIGRRATNDIHIDNLAVSGDHAVIVTIGNDSFLEDLNSTNGTLVNAKSTKKHVLQHGDIMEFGKYQLRYENTAQAPVKATPQQHGFENTAVMRPPPKQELAPAKAAEVVEKEADKKPEVEQAPTLAAIVPPLAKAPLATPEAVAGVPKLGRLQVLTGANAGSEMLLNKALTTLGQPGVQVVVITKRPHGYFLAHVEGEKRPLINGQNMGPQAHALINQDVIDLVGSKMEFYLI